MYRWVDGRVDFYLRKVFYFNRAVIYMGQTVAPQCVYASLLSPTTLYYENCFFDNYLFYSFCEKKMNDDKLMGHIKIDSSYFMTSVQTSIDNLELCPSQYFVKSHLACDIDAKCRSDARDDFCSITNKVCIPSLNVIYEPFLNFLI